MKKTLTAHIGGVVFHLEEDAYAALQDYLERVRRQFAGTSGDDEIMADIEARIAELLQERQNGRREAVTMADVEQVIEVMGRPEDLGEAGEPGTGDREADGRHGRSERRLYRDTVDRWAAGVLSGLAAYIGTEVTWLRIAFIVLVLVGWGAPVLFYLILWLLVPEAHSASERLRMRGEPVTAENLRRMFEEGAEHVKAGAERMAGEARDMGRRYGPRAREWSQEMAGAAQRTARGAGGLLVRLLGMFLLLIGGLLAVALFGATVGALGFTWYGGDDRLGMDLADLGAMVLPTATQTWWMLGSVFMLVAVPVVMLLFAGFGMLLDLRTPRVLAVVAGILWWAALSVVLIIGLRSGSDLMEEARQEVSMDLRVPTGGVLLLSTLEGDSVQRTTYGYRRFSTHWSHSEGLYRAGDSLHASFAWLQVEKSPDSLYHLIVVREARGRHGKVAAERCARITAQWRQQGDSLLLGKWFSLPVADKYRFQRVRYVVQVPVGGAVRFLSGSAGIIHDIPNTGHVHDREMVGRTWRMTSGGLEASEPAQGTVTGPHPRSASDATAAIPFRGLPRRTAEEEPVRSTWRPQLPDVIGLLSSVVRG